MRTTKLLALILLAATTASFAHAQKTTERFIPIGKSPGLSGKVTLIGKIEAVDRQKKTLTCADTNGTCVVKVTDQTRIWVDRTQENQTNLAGAISDCQKGRVVEVKFLDKERRGGTAEWIKIR